jgi:hypothetical protein
MHTIRRYEKGLRMLDGFGAHGWTGVGYKATTLVCREAGVTLK